MRPFRACTRFAVAAGLALVPCAVHAQITSNEGDGILNAPYRGTIDSLRDCTMDLGYGEVKSHVEPLGGSLVITSSTVDVWVVGNWDRSVLRLFQGIDASGNEVDLHNTSQSNPFTVSVGSEGFVRFSLKAIGTKSLGPQEFTVKFYYKVLSTWITKTYTFRVAPMTGRDCGLPGESEAFHFGTPLLAVSVGNASLTVPVGRTAEMIGATFIDKDPELGPSGIRTTDVVFPGAAESLYIQYTGQFRLGGSSLGPNKTSYGTPWPGHMIGYYAYRDIWGPDGTHYDSDTHYSLWFRRFDRIRPLGLGGLGDDHSATVEYEYDDDVNNRVTEIRDIATTPNVITLQRTAGVVTHISTLDGRGWTIQSDGADGWITGIIPDGTGKGARYFTYTPDPVDPEAAPRIAQVKDEANNVMYEFQYQFDGDGVPVELSAERRFVDGNLETVVEHVVSSESLRLRKEYIGTGDFRQYDFAYDTSASPNALKHRLASVTAYSALNGTGTSYTTEYTHDVENADGSMVIDRVDLADDSWIDHEYDSHIESPTVHFGFRTKSTHTDPNGGPLIIYDVDYDFFYPYGTYTRLYHSPRIVKQRDGRGIISEVIYDYEEGDLDENSDGLYGEESNQLFSVSGPTITQGPSAPRTPETRYTYDQTDRVLTRQETDYGSQTGQFRAIAFGYDELLRVTSQTVDPDPGGKNLITQYQYRDDLATQNRITIDADDFYTEQKFDNDGRLLTTQRFLTSGGTAGSFYQVENVYDVNGRLEQQNVDNKDQDGNPIVNLDESNPIVTQYAYDLLGRLTTQTLDPGGTGQEDNFDYNWLGEIEKQYDTSDRGTERTRNGRGLIEMETPLDDQGAPVTTLATTFQYDELGNLRYTYPPTNGVGPHEERLYDDFGRLEQIKRHPGTGGGGGVITTTFVYDEANNVTRTTVEEDTNVLSISTEKFDEGGFNYESRRKTTTGVDVDADPVTEREFDWAGNLTVERSLGDSTPENREITTIYDTANRVEKVLDSEGGETRFVLDGRGNATKQSVKLPDSEWAVTDTQYDALSRAKKITEPEDHDNHRAYRLRRFDSRGNLRRDALYDYNDAAKMTRVFGYDNASRQTYNVVLRTASHMTEAIDADVTSDGVVETNYDADGRQILRVTYNNTAGQSLFTTTTYDALGRVNVVTDPSTAYTDDEYLPNGRLDKRHLNDGVAVRTTDFAYDGHDRVKVQTRKGTPDLLTQFEYDGLDRQIRITDPMTIKTKTEYDLVGRREAVVENEGGGALERRTEFSYNRLSQLIQQIAKNRAHDGTPLTDQTTTYRSDSLGRRTRTILPDSNEHGIPDTCGDCIQMDYDLAGRMITRTDQRGYVTTQDFDDRGLLIARSTPVDGETFVDTFEYDAARRMVLAQRDSTARAGFISRSEMAYTDLGDLDYEDQTIGLGADPYRVDYWYDQAGNRMRTEYPHVDRQDIDVTVDYWMTEIGQVDWIEVNDVEIVDYTYSGRMLDQRRVTTDESSETVAYVQHITYDTHGRFEHMRNTVEAGPVTTTIADYLYQYDENGNVVAQFVLDGQDDFRGDDRVYTVDDLNRLTDTTYLETGETESTELDLVGNREAHTDRAGETTAYTLLNEGNEYATIDGTGVVYDLAGNLTEDEDDRLYVYDEQNRLIEVQDASRTPVATFTYDALGRRVSSVVDGVETRYYYDGKSVIEERDASDVRTAYHVNGGQFIDERVATSKEGGAAPAFSYPLLNRNFSVAGRGNASGSTISRQDFSAVGDFTQPLGGFFFDADDDDDIDLNDLDAFVTCLTGPGGTAGSGCEVHDVDEDGDVDVLDFDWLQLAFGGAGVTPPYFVRFNATFYHDADGDRDVDLDDFVSFDACYDDPPIEDPQCIGLHDFDSSGISTGVVDAADLAGYNACAGGPHVPAPESCLRSAFEGNPPETGDFTLHGRPVDVLPDGKALTFVRARYLDPEHGRWFQRDPSGYADGPNLYEAFRGNAMRFRDALGRQSFGGGAPDDAGTDPASRLKKFFTDFFIPDKRMQAAAKPAPPPLDPMPSLGPGLTQVAEQVQVFQDRLELFESEVGVLLVRGSAVIGIVVGVTEIAEGTFIIVYSPGAGALIGIPIVAHGFDVTRANIIQYQTGVITETVTYELIASTGHPYIARAVDIGIPMSGGVAAFARAPLLGEARALTAFRTSGRAGAEITIPIGRLKLAGTGSVRAARAGMSRGAQLRARYGAQLDEYMHFRSQGFSPAQSKYLTQPYDGMGHHFLGRRFGLPGSITESPLNVMKPKGISIGRFYERHFMADPYFYGTKFPRALGGSWSGRTIGLHKPGYLGRLWYASPGSLKAVGGGTAAAGGGATLYWWLTSDDE